MSLYHTAYGIKCTEELIRKMLKIPEEIDINDIDTIEDIDDFLYKYGLKLERICTHYSDSVDVLSYVCISGELGLKVLEFDPSEIDFSAAEKSFRSLCNSLNVDFVKPTFYVGQVDDQH
jgi:hypothetical protein